MKSTYRSTGVVAGRHGKTARRVILRGGAALAVTALSAAFSVAFSAGAFANSAEPVTNSVPTGAVVINASGTATMSVSGKWLWPFSSLGATTTHPCDHRIGVGWGVVWNDAKDTGTAVTSHGVTLNVGSTGVEPANTDDKVTYDSADPCGTFTATNSPNTGDGDVSGTWTGTHTYPTAAAVPTIVCIVTYDLGPGTTPAPARLKLTYNDNSLVHSFDNGGTWDASPGGKNCVATSTFTTTGRALTTPALATQATAAAVGSAISDTATLSGLASGGGTGTVTFDAYGPTDTQCHGPAVYSKAVSATTAGSFGPVSFVPAGGAGTYRWVASYSGDPADNPVSGQCGASQEESVVTAAATAPAVKTTTPPPAPIPGVTTVHTGEPWAGDSPLVAGAVILGLSMVGLGLFRRRRPA